MQHIILSLNKLVYVFCVSDQKDQSYYSWEGTSPTLQNIKVRKDVFNTEPEMALSGFTGETS